MFSIKCSVNSRQNISFSREKLAQTASSLISEDLKTNIADLRRQWRKQKTALYSSSPIKKRSVAGIPANDFLPLMVLFITLGSAIFTICLLVNAVNHKASILSNQNGKYGSIEFAHQKKMEKLNKIFPVRDENGNILGGKRASIQFAYNMRNKIENNESPDEVENVKVVEKKELREEVKEFDDEEIINRLTLRMAEDLLKVYQQNVEKQDGPNKEALVKKLGEFGHFGTSVVKPLDLNEAISGDSIDSDVKEVEKSAEEAIENEIKIASEETKESSGFEKRDAEITGQVSRNDNPFRVYKADPVKVEDDPFRFN